MTTPRRYGPEEPFKEWVRAQTQLDSIRYTLDLNDVDFLWVRYKAHVDGVGTRNVQLAMFLEVKAHGHEPQGHQLEILYFHHQLLTYSHRKNARHSACDLKRPGNQTSVTMWHFGVFVLSLGGETPLDGGMRWGRFADDGQLQWRPIDVGQLIPLLRMDLDPTGRRFLDLRRHHATKEYMVEEHTPLGFTVDRVVRIRS